MSDDGRPRPDWGGWQGNPDDLWPSIGGPGRAGRSRADQSRADQSRGDQLRGGQSRADQSRAGRQDQQRHEQGQELRRRPGRTRPRLGRDEIVDAAIAIADAEGAEALSMRRIAQVLRSGTMSLYWHVSSKEQLLDLMRDMLMAEIEVPDASGDWRADQRAIAVSTRAMLRRHQWLMDFIGGRPPLGPATLLGLERSLATLAPLGLPAGVAFDVLTTVNTYVIGVVLREVQELRTHEAERDSGAGPGEVIQDRDAWRDRLAATGLFGHFIEFLDADIDPDAADTMEQRFEFGLDCLLDGIAARIAAR